MNQTPVTSLRIPRDRRNVIELIRGKKTASEWINDAIDEKLSRDIKSGLNYLIKQLDVYANENGLGSWEKLIYQIKPPKEMTTEFNIKEELDSIEKQIAILHVKYSNNEIEEGEYRILRGNLENHLKVYSSKLKKNKS